MEFETSDTSDKEGMFEDYKTSEDEGLRDNNAGDSSSAEEKVEPAKVNSKPGSQASNADPVTSNGRENTGSVVQKYTPSVNSGPDSIEANAAERIKSTTLRRNRNQVVRFDISSTLRRDQEIVIPDGLGTKLQEINYIADQINVSMYYVLSRK